MMTFVLRLALLAAHARSQDQDDILARVATFDGWFRRHEHTARHATRRGDGASGPDALPTWQVRSKRDIIRGELLYNRAKRVYRARTRAGNASVVLKSLGKHDISHGSNRGGHLLYLELMYMVALHGRPGIPELAGAWFEADGSLTYVVKDCGAPIGKGQGGRTTVMSAAFSERAAQHPLRLARSLLACFQSWASVGFFLDDFRANQFMLSADGDVFLVDGPKLLTGSTIGEHVVRTWGKTKHQQNNTAVVCGVDANCPSTVPQHSCRVDVDGCEAGSCGAPEARGTCRAGTCVLLSEKTHVFDVANRPWLLPFIADKAKGRDREFLLTLIRLTGADDPDDRPSFAELVRRIDVFAKARSRRRRRL
jgi:hypothetical protein